MRRAQIEIAVCGFLDNHINLLIKKLKKAIGVNFKLHSNKLRRTIQITHKEDVYKFYKYIGECEVDCFKYKWVDDIEKLKLKNKRHNWSALDWNKVIKLRKDGVAWWKIAKTFGISYSSLVIKANIIIKGVG